MKRQLKSEMKEQLKSISKAKETNMQHALPENNRSNKVIWSISQRGFQNNTWLQNLYFNFSALNSFDVLVFEDRRVVLNKFTCFMTTARF